VIGKVGTARSEKKIGGKTTQNARKKMGKNRFTTHSFARNDVKKNEKLPL